MDNNQEFPRVFSTMFIRNADIYSYGTFRRNDLHYSPYDTKGASKRIIHAVPNLINELTPFVREKLNRLNL